MKIKLFKIHPAVFFVIAILIIAYLFPREGTFRYQFYEGKPWRYGLLTAPNNFPIYKTEAEIEVERDSALTQFSPYYRIDEKVKTQQLEKLEKDDNLKKLVPTKYINYASKHLRTLYSAGIVSNATWDKLKKEGRASINVIDKNVAESKYISDFFTIRSAYEFLINNAPKNFDKELLSTCDFNNYISENITYDEATSERIRDEYINRVSLSKGMIQAGERIVDRGEIVDAHIYRVLRSLKQQHEHKTGGEKTQLIILIGEFFLVIGIMTCFWLYLFSFRTKLLHNRHDLLFLLLCITVSVIITELVVTYSLFNIYILPLAIIPIVIRTFFDSRTAMFTHLTTILLCSIMVPFPHEFLFLNVLAGMVSIFTLRDLSQRSQLVKCSFFIFVTYLFGYFALLLYQEGDFLKINWMMTLYFTINFILTLFTYALVYILERAFGFISDITLVELSNINTPLLRKLSENCPGTFQHSINVSMLAAAAADKIGCNSQLVRAGAMYHDIGKIEHPAFFTENQQGINPHDKLSFKESAQIIIEHITEGVHLAQKAGLPNSLIDFIRTHHGRGKTKYFYNSFINDNPDVKVDDDSFTYPGPNPFSKETAILMMADSVEAASRSLKEPNEENIAALIDKIIEGEIKDSLLRNAPLTFRDIDEIKKVFSDKLKTMYHTRISYPDLKK